MRPKVGDRVWRVAWRTSGYARVEKVGRKWLTVSGTRTRFDVETLKAEYGFGVEQLWPSQEEYETAVRIAKAWSDLRHDFRGHPPDGVDEQKIARARELLGLARGQAIDAEVAKEGK